MCNKQQTTPRSGSNISQKPVKFLQHNLNIQCMASQSQYILLYENRGKISLPEHAKPIFTCLSYTRPICDRVIHKRQGENKVKFCVFRRSLFSLEMTHYRWRDIIRSYVTDTFVDWMKIIYSNAGHELCASCKHQYHHIIFFKWDELTTPQQTLWHQNK